MNNLIKSYDEFLNENLSMPGGIEIITISYQDMNDRIFTFEVTCKNAEIEALHMAIESGAKQCSNIAKDFVKEIQSNSDIKVNLSDKTGDLINPMAIISFKSDVEEAFGPWFDKFIKKHKIKLVD